MTWLKIDDAFEDHPKVSGLSDAAHRLWVRAACWCRKPANAHTNGFVPRGMLCDIYRNKLPQKSLEKLSQELVDSKGGGMFDEGLWEPMEGGWQFHDWEDYQPTEEKPGTLSRKEAASIAGQRSAAVRRERFGTAQPNVPNDVRDRSPNDVRTTLDRTHRTTSEPPDPDPDPDPDPIRTESLDPRPDRLVREEPRVVRSAETGPVAPIAKREPAPHSGGSPPRETKAQPESVPRRGLLVIPDATTARQPTPAQLEAVGKPLAERAREIQNHQGDPQWLSMLTPQRWPELVEAAGLFHRTWDLAKPILGNYVRDKGVQALVELYSAGVDQETLLGAIRASRGDAWFQKQAAQHRPGLTMLTPEVVRRLVPKPSDAAWEAELAQLAQTAAASRKRLEGQKHA